jgi:hypothetical protein
MIGNKIVQQIDINWSKRILGKEALTQIKINIKIAVFKAKFKLEEDILIKIILFILKILINKSKGIIDK